jgi:hypothetical protein
VGKENRGRQRLVRSDALIQTKDKSKNKVSGEAKGEGGSLSFAASRRLDRACGGCVAVGLCGVVVCVG